LSGYTNIITDAEFTNCRYSDDELIAFCKAKRGAVCNSDLKWTLQCARRIGVSPLVVIAKQQHEGSLIEGWDVARKNRDLAMGYHISDVSTHGYQNQVYWGTRALYNHFTNSSGVAFAYDKGRFRASHATVSLYKYTPYWFVTRPGGWYGGNWSLYQIYYKYSDELAVMYPRPVKLALRRIGFRL
jgi:hypothetical protein